MLEDTIGHHGKVYAILILKEELTLEASPILAKLLELNSGGISELPTPFGALLC